MTFTFKPTNSASEPEITAVADNFIELKMVETIRLAVYDNNPKAEELGEARRWAIEIDYNFIEEQYQWNRADQVKLRNWGSKLNNIRYKLPKNLDFAREWYDQAFERAQQFETKNDWACHAKMGTRMVCAADGNTKYQTVPFQLASFTLINETPKVLFQSCRPYSNEDETMDYTEGFAHEFVLDKKSVFRRKQNRILYWSTFEMN